MKPETAPDPRLVEIQRQRIDAQKDTHIGQLLVENAQMRMQMLLQQEAQIKTEPKPEANKLEAVKK